MTETYGYEDDDYYEDDNEAYDEGYTQAYPDAFQDGFEAGNDRLAAEQKLEEFDARLYEAEVEALETEREQVERTENVLGMQIEEAEQALGWRLSPEAIDHSVALFLANDDQHIVQTIQRSIPAPDLTDKDIRVGQLAAEMEIAQMENEVDREEDAAAVPEEIEPFLDDEEYEAAARWNAEASRQRREFERYRRPLTDDEAEHLAERTFEAREAGDGGFGFLDADDENGRPLDMRNPRDRQLSAAEIIIEEQRKAGEDVSQAERNLAWELGEGHGGDE